MAAPNINKPTTNAITVKMINARNDAKNNFIKVLIVLLCANSKIKIFDAFYPFNI